MEFVHTLMVKVALSVEMGVGLRLGVGMARSVFECTVAR
jgi:hypothetical protein